MTRFGQVYVRGDTDIDIAPRRRVLAFTTL
jgi:hypothetical protein